MKNDRKNEKNKKNLKLAIYNLIKIWYNGDRTRIKDWYDRKNYMLANRLADKRSPNELMADGKVLEVYKFVQAAIGGRP